jgi:hypothetical protein
MPLLRSKYQPYFPDPDSPNNYNCDRATYCHPVQLGDTIYTQFYQTPCNQNEINDPVFGSVTIGAEILTNGTFNCPAAEWTLGSGWACSGNTIVHTPPQISPAYQGSLGLTVGLTYRISITLTRTAGSVFVRLGNTAGSTATPVIEETGTFTFDIPFLDSGVGDDAIYIVPSSSFDGNIDTISLKLVTYNDWDLNGSWEISDGLACHTEGTTGLLEESVANYIVGNSYYYIEVTISGYVQGSLDVYISDALAGTVTANGTFRYYDTPTIAGVVSFDPSSDFIGCISAPDLRLLKNSHVADLVTQDGATRYDVSNYLAYWEDKVTLSLNIEDLEVTDGCYYLEVFDACQIEGNELVANGDFTDGVTDWTRNNGFGQYDFSANSAEFIFDPITGLTTILTNGDFSAGATGWTLGAGWSISGGGALHTAGSTATLVQTLAILPSPPPPSVEVYWVQFTVSGRTAGSCTVRFGNSTIFSAGANDTFLFPVNPNIAGSVNLTFTPTSNFDGTIDDVSLFVSNQVWSDSVFLFNTVNPDFIAGNYLLEFEITAQSDPDIRVAIRVDGSPFTFFNTVGVHQVVLNNYTPGGQRVTLLASFVSGSNRLPGTVTVDNVSAVRIEPFEATYTSECLQYKELWGQRTRMITAYCDQESFGFEFQNTGFRLQQRVGVRSIAPTYPKEKQIQRSGNGSARVVYSGVEKYWQLHTAPTTETFHDAMAIMVDCDHFAIGETADNATEYIVEVEDYTPQWTQDGSFSLASVVMTLRIKEGGQKFNRHT